jgi:DNA-binding SARP family transcriptional activator/tetratricopeptide (TPR) repeat protein
MSLSIRLLGPPEVSLCGRGLRFGTKKALALLCYLATEGSNHPRRKLADLLWPRSNERHARADLRSTLSRLRKAIGEGGGNNEGHDPFAVEGDLLGLKPGGIELDLERLQAAISLARGETSGAPLGTSPADRRANATVEHKDILTRLEGTIGTYEGEFMEGFSLGDAPEFELWLEVERIRWRSLFGELCEVVSRLQAAAGRLEEAIGTARMWTKHAPLEGDAHRRLMELLSAGGEGEGALRAYEDFRGVLRRELDSEPSLRMTELAGRLREEVEERATLVTGLARLTTTALSAFQIPFVDRHEEFGELVSEYGACVSGRGPRVLAVMGEAGMGKTRLVKEFLGWAKARGAEVLEGAASEGAVLSYGPLAEAIRPRMERERAPEDLLEDAWLSELGRLLPELKERYPDLPSPSSGEGETAKVALFEAVARTVGALASRAPVVLFLDDLQWADAATLEVLDYAGRRWAEQRAPVLVLIAGRPEEIGDNPSFGRWLPSLVRGLPARSLTLPPLSNEDIEGLLRRLTRAEVEPVGSPREPRLSKEARSELERFGAWLAAETGGQPFYLVETLKALLEEGRLVIRARPDVGLFLEVDLNSRGGDELSSMPKSVREVVRGRLFHLSTSAYELLVAGAVLGRQFGFGELVAVAGLEETEGLRGLDELVGRNLLLEEGGGREKGRLLYHGADYSFSHEKIRQVAYTECGQARRQVLHRRAFEVLEEGDTPAAHLARHALAGALADQAFGYSVAAGDRAMEVFAVRDAIVHYDRARDLLSEEAQTGVGQPIEPSILELEHLYTQLGRAYELADEWEGARAAYETIRALGRELREARLEVGALNNLASLDYNQEADPPRARALLEEARRVAGEAGHKEALVETECNLVDLMILWAGEHEYSGRLAAKALASARALEEERPDLLARLLFTLARLEMIRGSLEESAAYAGEGAALSRELAERPPPPTLLPSMGPAAMGLAASWRAGTKTLQSTSLTILAYDRILQGRLREGVEIARESLDISRQLHERVEALALAVLGTGLSEIGEYEEALEHCRRGADLSRKLRNVQLLWHNLHHLGWAYEALLDLEKARRVHEEALELRGSLGPHHETWSSASLCAVATLSEDWQEAYAYALRAQKSRTSVDVLEGIHLYDEVEALLRGGDHRGAREEVNRFANRAKINKRDGVPYLRSLAVLSEWQGNTRRAITHLHEAHALAQEIELPKELWQIQSKIGELYERRGEVEQAQEAFSGAAQILEDLAASMGDTGLREGFLAAPRVRRVIEHH